MKAWMVKNPIDFAATEDNIPMETVLGDLKYAIPAADVEPEAGKPKADLVSVVRCRECIYYMNGKHFDDTKFCFRLRGLDGEPIGYNFSSDSFCSYGVREV